MARREEDDAVIAVGEIRLVELNRYELGEMNDDERSSFEARIEASPEAKARLEAVRRGHREAASRIDVAVDSARILERLDERAPSRWRFLLPVAFAAAAAIALVPLATPDETGPTTRTKGVAPALQMYVNDATGPRPVADGVRLTEGDAIQFRYRADGRRYLFVLSIDSRGVISPLYPDARTQSIAVDPNGTNVLEGSIILDDAVGPERIFAVFSEEPVAFEDLASKLEGASDVTSLPKIGLGRDDVYETSLLIMKE